MMKKCWFGFWIVLFLVSRLFVLNNPPYHAVVKPDGQKDYAGFSDVKQYYERYANMWHYGLTPYLKHLFEYPPGALPFMYLPLYVDQMGVGHYYLNYRVLIFFLEIILFTAILITVSRLAISKKQKWLALLFYVGAGVLGKDFWYDGLDLVFFGSFAGALIWRLWHGHDKLKHAVVFWALFWLSVSIKLLTVPLVLPLFFSRIKKWKREVWACVLGGLIVWGVPLAVYRTSLSVFLFFHGVRPLKYEAFGTFLIRTINDFTGTEVQSNILPHLPMIGPVSTVMEKVVSITFPIALFLALMWGVRLLWRQVIKSSKTKIAREVEFQILIKIVLVYLFTLFLSSKILSRPFHIWYIPLIAIFPFKKIKQQIKFALAAILMIALDTSPYIKFPDIHIGVLALDRVRDVLRFLPMMVLLVLSAKLPLNPGKMKP